LGSHNIAETMTPHLSPFTYNPFSPCACEYFAGG
jgi:hypothetical protein